MKITREFYRPAKDTGYKEYKPKCEEQFKNLFEVWVNKETNTGMIFQGKQSKPLWYAKFRNFEDMEKRIETNVVNIISSEKSKIERRKNGGNITEAAKCAKTIRAILKNKFPEIKFTVRSDSFSMGNSVDVHYTDGVPTEEVKKHISGFQYGHFNSMEDIYEISNSVEGRHQTKWLSVERTISQEHRDKAKKEIAKNFGIKNIEDEQEWHDIFQGWSDQVVYKEIREKTF